ncbi:chaperone protein dnaJ C76, chloroplastic [Selaginella moellendorffii]|nr:chaperone protein dnaJ C76, chloroplastic [Selaginella moellendorffii]|eukprot:XP_002971106.2 chaperone protein dnaJ C76, chloroplastic [Selaginella moellendorffii]
MVLTGSKWSPSPMLWELQQRKLVSPASRQCKAAASKQEHTGSGTNQQDYYEILGVLPGSSMEAIRKAYRKLQKQHHPDISGSKGHAMTLMLNEAYQVLSDERLRSKYDASQPHLASTRTMNYYYSKPSFTGSMYSTWNGPDRPQGIFVDENVCIGCRECAFAAKNTFLFDESTGCARVKAQWGDSDETVKVAIQTCPVNCIHWVERSDLSIYEYLIRPQPRPSNGVYGGGWERPSNIFMAAKAFKHQHHKSQQQDKDSSLNMSETPAQRKARMDADLKLKMGPFWSMFAWMNGNASSGTRRSNAAGSVKSERRRPLFGKACTSEIFSHRIALADKAKTVAMIQEWAINFASSSELPLPMPFQADSNENGVQLKLISTGDGVLKSIGSFLVTCEIQEPVSTPQEQEEQGGSDQSQPECFVCITRLGSTTTGPLPGESRIVKLVRDLLLQRDSSYASYRIPRSV